MTICGHALVSIIRIDVYKIVCVVALALHSPLLNYVIYSQNLHFFKDFLVCNYVHGWLKILADEEIIFGTIMAFEFFVTNVIMYMNEIISTIHFGI